MALSEDDDHCVLACADASVRLYSVKSGECLILSKHSAPVRALAIGRGAIAAVVREGGVIEIWDLSKQTLSTTIRSPVGEVNSIAFHPVRSEVIFAGEGQRICIWSLEGGRPQALLARHNSRVWALCYDPSGKIFLSGADDQTLCLWAQEGRCLRTLHGRDAVLYATDILANGHLLAEAHADGTLRVYSQLGNPLAIFPSPGCRLFDVAIHPEGKHVAVAGDDGVVRIWNLTTGECSAVLRGHRSWIWSLRYSDDGQVLVSSGGDGDVRIWRGSRCEYVLVGTGEWSFAACVDLRNRIAVNGDSRSVGLWQMSQSTNRKSFAEQYGRCSAVIISDSGEYIFSGHGDGFLVQWKLVDQSVVGSVQAHQGTVFSVDVSPGSVLVATGATDGKARLWDVESLTLVQEIDCGDDCVCRVRFFEGGKCLMYATTMGVIGFLNLATREKNEVRRDRLYERMKVNNTIGLRAAQQDVLYNLGARDSRSSRLVLPATQSKNKSDSSGRVSQSWVAASESFKAELVETLLSVTPLHDYQVRNVALAGIPMSNAINRNPYNFRADIEQIVAQLAGFGMLEGGANALRIFVENTLRYVPLGSEQYLNIQRALDDVVGKK